VVATETNMEIKVSIIIPVYNVEKYLRHCLDSCVKQTLDDIEIIIVNDASPDGSGTIMREYEERYPEKIKCIFLKENLRQGGARNVAIRCARGEFIAFVDGDDWIELEMCQKLYYEAKQSCADIVYCNTLGQRKNNAFFIDNRFPDEAVGYVSENIIGILTQPYVGPCASIIKRNIIIDNDLLFPEKLAGEDTAITKLWDLYAKKISKIEEAYYVYRYNMESTGRAKMKQYRSDEYESVKILYDNLMKCNKLNNYREECSLICLRYALNFTNAMIKKSGSKFNEQVEEGFNDCIHYICSNLVDNSLWKRWFTPEEKKCLLTGIDFECYGQRLQINDVEDYKQYYKELTMEINNVFVWLNKQGKKRIAIWGKTEYAIGFREAFPELTIVDQALDIDEYQIECVICLRVLHVPNIRRTLQGKGVELFNMQGYLWTGGDMSRFFYF